MLYPSATRVAAEDFMSFFRRVIRPSLPDPKGMPNGSFDTPLRNEMVGPLRELAFANTYHLLLIGIR